MSLLQRIARAFGTEGGAAAAPDVDPQIAETIRVVRPYTMTSGARLAALCDAVRYVVRNRIPGGIVECGVWRGGSMMAAARTLMESGDTNREMYLFDTFEGMTEPGEADVSIDGQSASALLRDGTRTDTGPESVWCYAPLEGVEAAMRSTGYDPARVNCVKGPVEETLPKFAPERIALLRLDTDWYESTRHELLHLYPRLSEGGVLILDDYGHWQGARRAVDEYFAQQDASPLLHRIDYTGRSAIKTRRS